MSLDSQERVHADAAAQMMQPTQYYQYYQRQSRLFGLPRELRDQIYQHYVSEPNGYVFDSSTEKLKLNTPSSSAAGNDGICQSLRLTCKLAAEETRGLALKENTMVFRTGLSGDVDGDGYRGLTSLAGRLRCVLDYYDLNNLIILSYATELDLLSPKVFRKMRERFPTVGGRFEHMYADISDDREPTVVAWDTELPWAGSLTSWLCHYSLETFSDVARFVLQQLQVENPAGYRVGTVCAFETERLPPFSIIAGSPWRHYFDSGSREEILSIQILEYWSIPQELWLRKMEMHLTSPSTEHEMRLYSGRVIDPLNRWHSNDVDFHQHSEHTRWYFSAASMSINFLQKLPQGHLQYVRNMVLHEDRKAVARPACHLRGFIPYCQENTQLRIMRRIGYSENMLPLDWNGIDQPGRESWDKYEMDGHTYLCAFVQWMEEAVDLSNHGMPLPSCQVILGTNDGDITQKAWELVMQVAVVQDAFTQWYKMSGLSLTHLDERRYLKYTRSVFPMPDYLPKDFSRNVHDIAQGRSILKVHEVTNERWDVAEFVKERQSWTLEQWQDDWVHLMFSQESVIDKDLWKGWAEKYHIS